MLTCDALCFLKLKIWKCFIYHIMIFSHTFPIHFLLNWIVFFNLRHHKILGWMDGWHSIKKKREKKNLATWPTTIILTNKDLRFIHSRKLKGNLRKLYQYKCWRVKRTISGNWNESKESQYENNWVKNFSKCTSSRLWSLILPHGTHSHKSGRKLCRFRFSSFSSDNWNQQLQDGCDLQSKSSSSTNNKLGDLIGPWSSYWTPNYSWWLLHQFVSVCEWVWEWVFLSMSMIALYVTSVLKIKCWDID